MSLKLIPIEQTAAGENKKQKHFNPGRAVKNAIKNNGGGRKDPPGPFKNLCFRLIRFINRGSRFTCEQIDELIISLHHTILNLQKKKQEILKRRVKNPGK